VSDESGDEVLEARPARIRPWQYVTVGLVVVLAALVQVVARHGLDDVVPGSGHAAVVAAPPPRVIKGPGLLSSVVGNRCPSGVICGIGARVSPGMNAQFRKNFPDATVGLQASAFDAGAPRTFWQQINATTPAGTSVVLTEQRVLVGPHGPSAMTVNRSPDGKTVTVSETRANWRVMANLDGTSPSAIPVSAARQWVAATPLPR
jgi:hypothetical protein